MEELSPPKYTRPSDPPPYYSQAEIVLEVSRMPNGNTLFGKNEENSGTNESYMKPENCSGGVTESPPAYTGFPCSSITKQKAIMSSALEAVSSQQLHPNVSEDDSSVKLYKRRFWILGLFSTCSMLNAMQWIQYSVITDILLVYYNVTVFDLNWMSLVYFISYIPLAYPVSVLLHKQGMRTTLLIGSLLTCVSTTVQCFSQGREGYSVALASQIIASIAQVFILPLPPRLAAVWFGPEEVCRATSVGAFGNQLGVALGFLFTPSMISDGTDMDLVRQGRSIVAYTLTACNVVIFLLILITFQKQPVKPPSRGQASKNEMDETESGSMKELLKNRNFVLLVVSYGLILGVLFGLGTVLNQMVEVTHKNASKEIGWLGGTFTVSGLLGSLVVGFILDKTHKFKETSLATFILSLLSVVLFAGCLYFDPIWPLFIAIIVLGFFLASYVPVGFEYAVEITYPAPEGTTASILNTSIMVFGIPAVMLSSSLLENYGRFAANLFYCVWIGIGTICIACIKSELRRSQKNQVAIVVMNNNELSGPVNVVTITREGL